ncbi:Zn-ribbon domain-containing OB-fold protein [Actinomycetospora aeridis]|uniref:OB-fold domain-containing protein n=1 Tax=Actinomycetospora aeridis TaxID=3129231 RepID=A0ABU8NFC1_9PSEU
MGSELGVGRPTKRRPGPVGGGLPVADSRPVLADGAVLGVRCTVCRYPAAQSGIPWCPSCYGAVEPARFATTGAVWSSTVVAIPVGHRRPPFGLAYVDVDDGPRLLTHLAEARVLPIGTRVRVTGTDEGDLVVEEES